MVLTCTGCAAPVENHEREDDNEDLEDDDE